MREQHIPLFCNTPRSVCSAIICHTSKSTRKFEPTAQRRREAQGPDGSLPQTFSAQVGGAAGCAQAHCRMLGVPPAIPRVRPWALSVCPLVPLCAPYVGISETDSYLSMKAIKFIAEASPAISLAEWNPNETPSSDIWFSGTYLELGTKSNRST